MASTIFEDSKPTKRPIVWPQWLAAIDVFLLSIVIGMIQGWSSPYLAKFASSDSELAVTDSDASWIASIIGIGRVIGSIMGVILVDKLGTKGAVLYNGVPLIISWVCLLTANSVIWIYISRLLSGVGMGIFFSAFPLYIGEIANPSIRGALVGLITQGMPAGVVLGNVIGAYTPMWVFSCVALVPNIAFIVLIFFKPESPQYLVLKGRFDEAKRSLEWYNRGVDVSKELETIKQYTSFNTELTYMKKFRELATPVNRKSVMIVSVVYIMFQLSGLYSLAFYMEIILKNAGVTVITPSLVVIIVGILGIVAGWITTYTNDACGRKIMLAISSLGVAISVTLLGIDYQLLDLGFESGETFMQWLPIASFISFQMTLAIGLMPVPSTLMSEMFSPNIKGIATCLINISSAIVAFISLKSYQPMVDVLTEKYVFWIYSAFMLFLTLYSIFVLPETNGKSLPEIQQMLTKKKIDPIE